MSEISTEILIVGGGTGGSAAALSCLRAGVPCVVVEETDWLGGQLTSQGVPPDENRWVEERGVGATLAYQILRARVRRWYRENRALTPAAAADACLNPGGGWVSRLCAEPRVWHDCLRAMLNEAGGANTEQMRVLLHARPVAVDVEGDTVRAVTFERSGGERFTVRARFVLDATETGDLLELAKIEHAIGAEHESVYNELHGRTDFDAVRRLDPLDQQAVSWCFALEHRPGEEHVIDRPAAYDRWRSYTPENWTGPLFSWTVPSHNDEGRRTFRLVPWPDEPTPGEWEMWRYRRIVDRSIYLAPPDAPRPPPNDVALINMVQMDYWMRPLLGVSAAERTEAASEARELSKCFLYWMQTEAPRHDNRDPGYPGLRRSGDALGTPDGFAKAPYIREPRRLLARTVLSEGHLGTQQRRRDGHATAAMNWDSTPEGMGTAHRFEDSIGVGHYMIDLHPSCAGRSSVYVQAAPFRIPMGSLVPVRVRNVLAAGKCLGVSHIANGSTRMHAVEWNVGESAGALAAWCVQHGTEPAAVHADPRRVRDVQSRLADLGIPLAWPWEK